MLKIKIDNKELEVEEGCSVLEAAQRNLIDIPNLCAHENLSPFGACRLCTVEIKANGKSGLTAACTFPVVAGMEVRTDTAAVKQARKLAMELLLAVNPKSERIQKLAKKLGVEKPGFSLEERKCILCGLCVRACREQVGAAAIDFVDQGKDRDVKEAQVVHSEKKCIGCDSCAYICPVAAITVEDKSGVRRLSTPSGTLKFKLKKCKKCGRYWAPEKQIEYIARLSGQKPEDIDVCPDCR